MAYFHDDTVIKSKGTDLSRVDLERQCDIYRLSTMGDARSDLLWRQFARGNPQGARLVIAYLAAIDSERADSARDIDRVVVKAKSGTHCLGCMKKLKPRKHQNCPGCGRRNPNFIAKKGPAMSKGKRKSGKQRAFKGVTRSMITKAAHRAATGGEYAGASRGAALNAMWQHELRSTDPARREVAWNFLHGSARV